MESDLGFSLRMVSLRRQLSQRALAKKAVVANATISLIESGNTSPSVSALKLILAGIPMTLAEFFSNELPGMKIKVFYRAKELTEISDGEGSPIVKSAQQKQAMPCRYCMRATK